MMRFNFFQSPLKLLLGAFFTNQSNLPLPPPSCKTKLELRSNSIRGSIPSEIGNLIGLKELKL